MAIEIPDFDVEVTVVMEAVSGDGLSERHCWDRSRCVSPMLSLWGIRSNENPGSGRLVEGMNWKRIAVRK